MTHALMTGGPRHLQMVDTARYGHLPKYLSGELGLYGSYAGDKTLRAWSRSWYGHGGHAPEGIYVKLKGTYRHPDRKGERIFVYTWITRNTPRPVLDLI